MTSVLLHLFIAIDYDSPADSPAFSYPPSIWSMHRDTKLVLNSGQDVYAALGYSVGSEFRRYPAPLIPLRGIPPFELPFDVRHHLEMEDEFVGWLLATELFAVIKHAGIHRNSLHRSIRIFLEVVEHLVAEFGNDRICVIFSFIS